MTLGESSKMNCSAFEWAFQLFLHEAFVASETSPSSSAIGTNDNVLIEIKDQTKLEKITKSSNSMSIQRNGAILGNGFASNILVDYKDYQAFLKSKLNLACAVVALTWAISSFDFSIYESKLQEFSSYENENRQGEEKKKKKKKNLPKFCFQFVTIKKL